MATALRAELGNASVSLGEKRRLTTNEDIFEEFYDYSQNSFTKYALIDLGMKPRRRCWFSLIC